ncbi:MAG: ABC transporter ATP-binding protein [Bacillota bacterium]
MTEKVLEVKELSTRFKTRKGWLTAVENVSFDVHKGELLAIVGESGCGKSVTARSILGLVGGKKGEKVEGSALYRGENLLTKSEQDMLKIRGREISMIFQDPMTSLNPVYMVGSQVAEMPLLHEKASRKKAWSQAVDMIDRVGISSPELRSRQYPHQFSGGMRQRAVIAMSLICSPHVLFADEPTTALDVTIQNQILKLLKDLRDQTGTAIILITHDLGVVAETCDNVAVMYTGNIVEKSSVEALFARPLHPYTRGLLNSVPRPGEDHRLEPILGQPPNPSELPAGCHFATRCPEVLERCHREKPQFLEVEPGHFCACWLLEGDAK